MKKSFIVLIIGASLLNYNTPLEALSFKNQKKEVKAPLENIDNTMALSDVFAVGEGKAEYLSHYNSEHIEEKIKNMLNSKEKNITEKINQAKNNAMKEVKQLSTIIAVESAKKLISQTIEKNKIEEINFSSVKENLENLKKNI